MPSMLDHVADKNGAELVMLAKQYDFPAFVKQADLQQTMNPGRLQVHLYADPRAGREQFPCHTAASTWLSTLYFTEKRAEFHPKDAIQIENRLNHYINYWRIKEAADYIKQQWEKLHKQADDKLPDSMYAYVWTNDNGQKERRLRLKTAAEVKAAADWLFNYRDRIAYTDRNKIAVRVLEKAASYGARLGDKLEFIEKQAGRGVGHPDEIIAMIEGRARLLPPDRGVTVKLAEDGKEERTLGLKDHFFKMANMIKKAPRKALQPDMLVKLCETIDILDRQQNFTPRYLTGLVRPEDVIFKSTFAKVAEDLTKIVATTSGKVYEKESFAKLAISDIESLFGTEFADRVTTKLGELDPEKMAEEVSTLPRPDAELLDSLLSDNGIRPILHKAASVRQGFSKQEQEAWAAAYETVK